MFTNADACSDAGGTWTPITEENACIVTDGSVGANWTGAGEWCGTGLNTDVYVQIDPTKLCVANTLATADTTAISLVAADVTAPKA